MSIKSPQRIQMVNEKHAMSNETRSPSATVSTLNRADQARRNYAPPSLKVFGPIGALTQAGTSGMAENMAMSAPAPAMS